MESLAAASSTRPAPASKGLNATLWIVQVLLAVMFGMAGLMKTTAPIEELATKMTWVPRHAPGFVRFVGVSELLGGLGLLLPSLTRIAPLLTPAAAGALATVMVLAMGEHLMNGEAPMIAFNLVLGGLAAFVAWGRLKKAPIAPRGA